MLLINLMKGESVCLFVLCQRLKRGFWAMLHLLASPVGLYDGWLGCLVSSWWVFTTRKSQLEMDQPKACFCPWSLMLSLSDKCEQCWRRWIACRWSNLMQPATRGSAMSMCLPFRCHWTLVVLIVGGWPFCFPLWRKGDLTWDMREWEMRWCHLLVQCFDRGQPYVICWAAMDLEHGKG